MELAFFNANALQWIRIAIRTQLTNLVGRLNVFRVL